MSAISSDTSMRHLITEIIQENPILLKPFEYFDDKKELFVSMFNVLKII